MRLRGGSAGIEPNCNAGDAGDAVLIPGWARSPGGGHGACALLSRSVVSNSLRPYSPRGPLSMGIL